MDNNNTDAHSTSAPNYYHELKYLIGNIDQLVHWAAIDKEANSFSIVDEKWTIYNTIHQCYNNWHAQDLLRAHGIDIHIVDIEHGKAIYNISSTK